MLKAEPLRFSAASAADGKQNAEQVQASIRNGFLRKVFGIVSLQLSATAALCALCMYVETLRMFMVANPSLPTLAFLLSIALLIACYVYIDKHPINVSLLIAWTASNAVIVASECARCQAQGLGTIVIGAVGITAAITVGLSLYTLSTKKDFSFLGAGLASWLGILVFMGLWSIFFPFSNFMQIVYSGLGCMVFSLYILYDVWNISHRMGPDEYIEASISLYLDIINLFLDVLRFLVAISEKD